MGMRADRPGSERTIRTLQVWAPWAILLVVVAQVAPKLWLFAPSVSRLPLHERITEVLFVVLPVPFATVGALIAARRPGHRIGWLLLVGALSISTAQLTWGYAVYGLDKGALLPGAAVVGWVGNWIPWPALAAFTLLLLPRGMSAGSSTPPLARARLAGMNTCSAWRRVHPRSAGAPQCPRRWPG
jgi:hypothetical protein